MSFSVQPHGRQPTRLLCPWDSPGKNTGVGCHFLLQGMKVKSESEVAQSCPTLCNPMDGSPLGSSVPGILQARTLEWVAISFSNAGCFSTSSSNCCFLTCIQVSQEAGQVVWYSHSFRIFQFIVIHPVKGFGIVNKAEIDVFLGTGEPGGLPSMGLHRVRHD